MPVLASVLLVGVLSFAAVATESLFPSTADPSSLLAQSATAGTSEKEGVANSQCPKPAAGQRYYVTADRSKWNTYVKDEKTRSDFFNLYGKPCKEPTKYGGAIVETVCTRANYCDGGATGAKCFQYDLSGKTRESVDCKLYQGKVQTAAYKEQGSGVCEGCTTGSSNTGGEAPVKIGGNVGSAGTVPPPTAPAQSVRGIDNAFRDAPAAGGAIQQAPSQPRINELLTQGGASQDGPVRIGGAVSNAGQVRLNPDLGKVAIAPAGGAPIQTGQIQTGLKTGTNPFGRTTPIAQSTFGKTAVTGTLTRGPSPITQATSRQGGFGSVLTNIFNNGISAQGILSGITNLMSGIANSTRTQSAPTQTTQAQAPQVARPVIQQTIVVAAQKPTTMPTAPDVTLLPSLPQDTGTLYTSPTTRYELTGAATRTPHLLSIAVDIGEPTSVDDASVQDSESTSTPVDVAVLPVATTVSPDVVAPSSIPTPVFLATDASTSGEIAHDTFIERVRALSATTSLGTAFRSASTTMRTTSIVEVFHAISIPDLLDAITQGSMDLINRVLARGTPEKPVVTTIYDEAPIIPIVTDGEPLLPTSGGSASIAQGGTSASVQSSAQVAVVTRNSSEFTDILRDDSTWIFREASPAHQAGERIALSNPRIFPDVIPVPQREEEKGPAVSGTVENIVRSVKNIVASVLPWLGVRAQ